ncbi:MAG: Dabb family protein [Candidatus Microbacterium colombiense]|nr:MAG: Dabb family protein [Microbacterium sp.]
MTIRHVVSWKLTAEDADVRREQAHEVARRLNGLKAQITQIQSITAGANIAYPEANWDVTLVADFATLEALEEYQVHPAHVEVAGFVRSVVASRASVDFEI